MFLMGWEPLDKGMIYVLGGTVRNFIRMVHNLKLMNCLILKVSICYDWTSVDLGSLKPRREKPRIRRSSVFKYIFSYMNLNDFT